MLTLAGKFGLTVIVIFPLVAGLAVAQVALEVKTTVTISPFDSAEFVYVALLVPTFPPFNFHWYAGDEPPLLGVAVKVTFVPAQIVELDAEMLTLAGKFGLTVIVIFPLVAGLAVAQVALEVKTTVTISPFDSAEFVYVALLVPTFPPFNFHWYAGDEPPLLGVAVKVTFVPAQIVELDAAMLTLTGKLGFTVIVIFPLVAGFVVAQVALEVKTTVTMSPFANVEFVYVVLLIPTFPPFNFH